MQVVNLFLILFLAIETSMDNFKNVAWIKSNIYDQCYCALNILDFFFIIKIAKLLVEVEDVTTIAQKNKKRLLEIVEKAQKEISQPIITKLLHTYMTFAIDSPDFSLSSLLKIAIYKNNSMRIALNSNFDASIFNAKGWSGRALGIFTTKNIEEDELALFIHKQKKIETDILDTNMGVKKEKKEVYANLELQYIWENIKLQVLYKVLYKKRHNYQFFHTLTLISKDELALLKAYISKSPVDRIFIIYHDIQ